MAITINGNGTIGGVSVGGLPDGIVDTDMLASAAVTSAKVGSLGASNMPAGSVVQVVINSTTTQITASNNTVADILSTTITPQFSTSKILVLATVMGVYRNAQSGYSGARVAIWLYRGGTAIQACDGTFYLPSTTTHFRHGGFSINHLDNPATTSATTYTLKFQPTDFGAAGQVCRDSNSGATTLTLLEIAQ